MSSSIYYDINYSDGSFEDQLDEEGPNPLLDLRIVVNGVEIKGAAEDEYHLEDYMGMHIVKLLNSIPMLQDGETIEFRFYSHPQVLLLEPNGAKLSIACISPTKVDKLTDEDKFTISKEAFVQEVLRVAKEFIEKVVEVDEAFAEHDRIRDIEQRMGEIRANK